MYTLDRPNLSDTPEEIFENCVNDYTLSPDKVAKLLPCTDLVKQDAQRYEALIRSGATFPKPTLPGNVKAAELYAVYDEKFVKQGTKGREKYYDKIINRLEENKLPCPICGRPGTITLDHYLPKSEYPTLCVMPDNLLPICLECNKEKGIKSKSRGDGEPVHLYFDRFPQEEGEYVKAFLFVRLGPHFEVEYYIDCPLDWDGVLRSRISDQMSIYNLCRRFGGFAVIEMGNLQTQWEQDVKSRYQMLLDYHADPSAIDNRDLWRRTIESTLKAEIALDSNSWKTALCRALYEKVDDLVTWLENQNAAEKSSCA